MDFLRPKYKPKKYRPALAFAGEFLIFIFIFFFVWSAVFLSFNYRVYANRFMFDLGLAVAKSDLKELVAEELTAASRKEKPKNELIIPKIGVSAPIVAAQSAADKDILRDLEKGVVLYPGSVAPGKSGKTVILGHSSEFIWYNGDFPTVFGLIDKLRKGDEITVVFGGKIHKYRVEEKFIKTPRQIQNEVKGDGLYLMSCWPVGTDYKRIVIRATLI
jgi:LPXTG-site transpeptidase (sortase) family protein